MGIISKTTKIIELDYHGHQIEISNWWRAVPAQSEASLSVDGNVLASTRKFAHLNPEDPIFSVTNISDSIQSLEVFIIGVFEIKFAVKINGETVYRDEISYADKLQKKVFGQESS